MFIFVRHTNINNHTQTNKTCDSTNKSLHIERLQVQLFLVFFSLKKKPKTTTTNKHILQHHKTNFTGVQIHQFMYSWQTTKECAKQEEAKTTAKC